MAIVRYGRASSSSEEYERFGREVDCVVAGRRRTDAGRLTAALRLARIPVSRLGSSARAEAF